MTSEVLSTQTNLQSSEVPVKYVPPRIDEDRYQATVPDMRLLPELCIEDEGYIVRGSRVAVVDDHIAQREEFLVWVKDFLSFSSQFPSVGVSDVENIDEVCEFLHRYDYDVTKACFVLSIDLARGKDFFVTEQYFNFLEKSPAGGAFTDFKERHARLMRSNRMLGAYSYSTEFQSFVQQSSALSLSQHTTQPLPDSLPPADVNSAVDLDNEVLSAMDEEEGAGGRRASSRVASSEKVESRKRWLALLSRVGGGIRGKVPFRDAQTLLDEAVSIPIPFNIALCSAGSAAQASNDLAAVDNARVTLSDFVKRTAATRLWIAEVRDTLYRNSVNSFIVDPQERPGVATMNSFDKLLAQGRKLDLEPSEEINCFEYFLRQAAECGQSMRSLISSLTSSPLLIDATFLHSDSRQGSAGSLSNQTMSTGFQYLHHFEKERYQHFHRSLRTYSVLDLEQLICNSVNKRLERCNVEDTLLLLSSFPYYFQETMGLTSSDASNAVSSQLIGVESEDVLTLETFLQISSGNNGLTKGKLSFSDLDTLLTRARLNPMRMNEIKYFNEVFAIASQVNALISSIVDFYSTYKSKSRFDPSKKRFLSWKKVCQLFLAVSTRYPVILPAYSSFCEMISYILNWKQEVGSFNTNNNNNKAESTSTDAGKRSRRSGANSSSAKEKKGPVPIKRVEALLLEGERFPFQFPDEMNLLRERKEQTKLWLEKLKKSIAPKRAPHYKNREEGVAEQSFLKEPDQSNKLTLDEMRAMVEDGKLLYQQMDDQDEGNGARKDRSMNKDLNKASSALEAAEDWILRFQETITSHVDHEISNFNNAKFWQQSSTPIPLLELSELSNDDSNPSLTRALISEIEGDSSSRPVSIIGPAPVITEEERRKDLIKELQQLLSEADSMPIALEEAEGIRCHLHALEWANKNRSVLLALRSPSLGDSGVDSISAAAVRTPRLRFSEISQLKTEITRIRGNSERLSVDFGVLAEEKICLEVCEQAEAFMTKMKKVIQGKEVRNGTSLELLRQLLSDAQKIPISFDYELRPVKSAVDDSNEWLRANASLLRRLNILHDEIDQSSSPDATDADSDKNIQQTDDVDNDGMEVVVAVNDGDPIISESEISEVPAESDFDALVAGASHLSTDFATIRSLKAKVAALSQWKGRLSSLKSKLSPFIQLLTARKYSSPLLEEISLEIAGNKRKGKEKEKDTSTTSNEEFGFAIRGSVSKMSLDNAFALIEEGKSFGLDLTKDLQLLQKTLQLREEWQQSLLSEVHESIQSQLSNHLERVQAQFQSSNDSAVFEVVQRCVFMDGLLSVSRHSNAIQEEVSLEEIIDRVRAINKECEYFPLESDVMTATRPLMKVFEIVSESSRAAAGKSSRIKETKTAASSSSSPSQWGDCDIPFVCHLYHRLSSIWAGLHDSSDETGETSSDSNESAPLLTLIQSDSCLLRKCWSDESEKSVAYPALATSLEFFRDFFQRTPSSNVTANGEDDRLVSPSPSSFLATKKRNRSNFEEESGVAAEGEEGIEEVSPAPKSTRLSSGIVKKRVDDSFADPSKIHLTRGVGVGSKETATIAEPQSHGKSNRSKAKSSNSKTQPANSSQIVDESLNVISAIFQQSQSDVFYFDLSDYSSLVTEILLLGSEGSRLFSVVEGLVSQSLQILWCFLLRLRECLEWKKLLQKAVSSHSSALQASEANESDKKSFLPSNHVIQLLEQAKSRALKCSERDKTEALYASSTEWIERARAMLSHEAKSYMKIEELKDFMKAGEKVYLIDVSSEIASLKVELKKAKAWKQAFESLEQRQSATKMEEMNELIAEAKDLCVDVSEYIDSVVQATRTYCLCRQVYFGQMIGCDTCDEWYHFQCVGLSVAQAEKAEKYTCIRCALRNSVQITASYAAKIANKWMDCMRDHFPLVDRNIASHQKKLVKESLELDKWRKNFLVYVEKNNLQPCSSSTVSSSRSKEQGLGEREGEGEGLGEESERMEVDNEEVEENKEEKMNEETNDAESQQAHEGSMAERAGYASAVQVQVEGKVEGSEEEKRQAQIDMLQREVNKLVLVVNSTKATLDKLKEAKTREVTKLNEIIDFMFRVLNLLYPGEDAAMIALGHPLGSRPVQDLSHAYDAFPELSSSRASHDPSESEKMQTDEDEREGDEGEGEREEEARQKAAVSVVRAKERKYEFGLSMRLLAKHYEILLPLGMQTLFAQARNQGILEIKDVQHIIEAFRWMNWAHLTLHLLRFPPPSPLLRVAVESAKTIHLFDEKITKQLTNISNKIGTWKTKTRKAFTNPKKLDEGKVNSLLLDGNNLPVTSRMKAILKVNHDKFQPKTASLSASAIATTSNVGGEGGVSSGSGKRNKTAASATQLLNSSSVATSASLSLSAIEAFPNSSDDETALVSSVLKNDSYNETLSKHLDNPSRLVGDPTLWYLRYSYPLNVDPLLAAEPSAIWPPVCEVPRKNLVKWK